MRPRYVIHKGIRKTIKAISRRFTLGISYTAAIYNPKDRSKKITASNICVAFDGKNGVSFSFPGTDTNKLKEGYATIEVYDSDNDKDVMMVCDNFAIIRKNSLPINDVSVNG